LLQAKTEEQVASEQAFLDAERVWLVHKEGFAAAGQLQDEENPAPEGRVRVQLDYNGDIIEVNFKMSNCGNQEEIDNTMFE
jgi:myosin-18